MANRGIWMWTSIGLLCALVVSSFVAAYYYTEYTVQKRLYNETLDELRKYDRFIFVNILVDYGNRTREWHNSTLIARGADLLDATRAVSEVNYSKGAYGAFVTHINAVGGTPNTYWLWYIWNATSSKWDYGPVASDSYVPREGETLAWIYTKF